ncbi:conserved hypothetical protein [Parafrankia sp. Ea1.12]|uniref:TIR domain-containing protein n=1 Tax=Parafrankia sp. Ea1.12 TaxID=573499 RepID=UPI000DA5D466|nr:TIR domain-containing protein [Parafrankia sp. Ea1.12]SQD97891.1 conserved hypothetical protein [Parafrankia sp. Ea1.12]
MSSEGRWDFLLSYAASDRAWAEWVAWQLESANYRVLIKAWDSVPGSNWSSHIQAGIVGSRRTILVLSAAYLRCLDDAPEWQAAIAANPSGSDRRLLPVRVEECEAPGLLARLAPIDLFDVSPESARDTLLQLVRHALDGRAKPTAEPAFPRQTPAASAARPAPAFPTITPRPAGARSPASVPNPADLLSRTDRPDRFVTPVPNPAVRDAGVSTSPPARPARPGVALARREASETCEARRPAAQARGGARTSRARLTTTHSGGPAGDPHAPPSTPSSPPPPPPTGEASSPGPTAGGRAMAAPSWPVGTIAVSAASWAALPTSRLTWLKGTTDAAVRRALDPLPDDAPAAVAYRPPVLPSIPAHQQALLDELETVAMAMLPAWLPESEAIESAGGAAPAAIRDLASKTADAWGISSRYLADLAERALRGGPRPRTSRFPPDIRAVGAAQAVASGFGRADLVLVVDPAARESRPAEQRALLDALVWFAYQGRVGVWLTGQPDTPHADRIQALPCPATPANNRFTRAVPAGSTVAPVAPPTAAPRSPPAAPGTSAAPAISVPEPPAATVPAVRGRPHPASRAEQQLERALSRQAWARGRAWNQPHRSGPLSALIYVDLAWFAQRVVVEVDGPEHRGMAHYERDRWRDNELGLEGFTVLRFTNEAVLGDVDLVISQIERCVTARRTPSEEATNP